MERLENDILDMECNLSVTGNLQMFQITKKFHIFAPAMPLIRKKKAEIYFFLPEESSQNVERRIFLEKYQAKLSNKTWFILISSDLVGDILPLVQLSEIKSVYFETMYMHDGVFTINFKFHSSDIKPVSGYVMEALSSSTPNLSIKLTYMGSRKSVEDALKVISSHFMLYSVTFASRPPSQNKLIEDNPLGLEWRRFIRFPGEEENIHGLYKIKGKPHSLNGVNVISEANGIYETVTTNPVLNEFALMANSQSLARFCENQEFDGNILMSSFVTMESHLHSYISLVDELNRKFKDWSIYIERVIPVSDIISQ